MIDYTKKTPETDAFMALIDDREIDTDKVRAKLHDLEIERDHARASEAELASLAQGILTCLNVGDIHRESIFHQHLRETMIAYRESKNAGIAAAPGPDIRARYGFCPVCGADGVSRERRPDGNDRCSAGHTYPSRRAVHVRNTERPLPGAKPEAAP